MGKEVDAIPPMMVAFCQPASSIACLGSSDILCTTRTRLRLEAVQWTESTWVLSYFLQIGSLSDSSPQGGPDVCPK